MTEHIGEILGVAHAATSGAAGSFTDPYFKNGRVARIARDLKTVDAAQNDTVVLAWLDWNTRFDAHSTIEFGDAGTSVNLDVGVANDPDCLIDGQDISTAAGSCSLLKSVAIGDRHKPLWQLAGYASAQAAKEATVADGSLAKVYATFMDANPGSVTLSWAIYGSPQ